MRLYLLLIFYKVYTSAACYFDWLFGNWKMTPHFKTEHERERRRTELNFPKSLIILWLDNVQSRNNFADGVPAQLSGFVCVFHPGTLVRVPSIPSMPNPKFDYFGFYYLKSKMCHICNCTAKRTKINKREAGF